MYFPSNLAGKPPTIPTILSKLAIRAFLAFIVIPRIPSLGGGNEGRALDGHWGRAKREAFDVFSKNEFNGEGKICYPESIV